MLLFLLACPPSPVDSDPTESESPHSESIEDTGSEHPPWTGDTLVRVKDPEGNPVPEAVVLMGGWSSERWVVTDAEGLATVPIEYVEGTERQVLAGKVGWLSAGTRVPDEEPTGGLDVVLRPLPDNDNPEYSFQPGGDSSSMSTEFCGHCHLSISDDWSGSVHAQAASDPELWDLYTGRASRMSSCEQGEVAQGQVPGQAQVADYCYVTEGVLGWLNEGCGGPGEPRCDHPDQRADLQELGGCGDCHSPATDGGEPGHIDLAGAQGVAFEGVTCDFCHKVRSVTPGPLPGLQAIQLERPSVETQGLFDYEPIMFGPYPDVTVPLMNGSYAPQFREPGWCSSCHEYGQPALHPDQELDEERWPEGLPVHETWSEFLASGAEEAGFSCQGCHMGTLYEDSAVYDTPDGEMVSPVHGWVREEGEVHHHDWPDAQGLGDPYVELALAEVEGALQASVTLVNRAAHAVPTGEPMRQVILLVSAVDAQGEPVQPVSGQTVPDVGGYTLTGVLGSDASLQGSLLSLPGAGQLEGQWTLRIVRPTGSWDDYAGPGTRTAEGLSPEQKGVALDDFVAEVQATASTEGLLLAELPDLQPGDRVYVVAEDQWAGAPGWLYAKVLVDAEGNRAVPHYRAIDVASDNRIPGFGSATSVHSFPTGELTVTATLLRRDHASSVSEPYGWPSADRLAREEVASWE